MYKEIINFEIQPIFNASEEICKEFAEIDIRCGLLIEKGLRYLCRDLDKTYFDILRKTQNSFAFGAYKSGEMIGFTSGFLKAENTMFTNALYVNPEYHNCGIGSKLLHTSEQAASLVATSMQLVSLEGATGFYKDRDYKNILIQGRIHKMKNLSKIPVGVVPVFGWSDKLSAKLNVRFDTVLLSQQKHQPIFVYVNPDKKIDGVATRLSNGEDLIKYNKRAVSEDMLKYRMLELSDALYMTR